MQVKEFLYWMGILIGEGPRHSLMHPSRKAKVQVRGQTVVEDMIVLDQFSTSAASCCQFAVF